MNVKETLGKILGKMETFAQKTQHVLGRYCFLLFLFYIIKVKKLFKHVKKM